ARPGGAMILHRPVGLEELILVYRTGLRRFPPRLPDQPIFYPVLNFGYAEQIARDWNTRSGSFAGYVTEFEVDDAYVRQFEVQTVGAREHQELWVPALALEEFNDHLVGTIRVVGAYFGPAFEGAQGRSARAQFESLSAAVRADRAMDVQAAVIGNHEAVFAHFPYWAQGVEGGALGPAGRTVLSAVQAAWSRAFPSIPVGLETRSGS
ncbi:MAG TPA: hypothetical protein VFV33_13375, partial [Gemmatimonadaceae bacterium]|nr:hypothetical protein [Gemmatimonadaceae bacterium]